MMRFVTDEDFDRRLLIGTKRRLPSLDIVRVQDVGLTGRLDDVLLEWAASEGRLMLTHDAATMPDAAYRRVEAGLPMPGVVVVNKNLQLGLRNCIESGNGRLKPQQQGHETCLRRLG